MISFFTVRIDIKMRSIVNSTCMTFHLSIATAPNLCLYACPYFEKSILFGFRIVKVFIQCFFGCWQTASLFSLTSAVSILWFNVLSDRYDVWLWRSEQKTCHLDVRCRTGYLTKLMDTYEARSIAHALSQTGSGSGSVALNHCYLPRKFRLQFLLLILIT